jgi:Cation transport protein
MTALIHAQVVQLRTLRSTYLVAGSLVALVALITGITMGEAGSADLRTESQLREPLVASAGIMVAVVMAIFAATRVAGEYRHATIAQRVLASPHRPRFVAATLLIHAALAGPDLDVLELVFASAATLGNAGVGLGPAGTTGSFAVFGDASTVAMTVLMWVGRLEILPVVVLLHRSFWRL